MPLLYIRSENMQATIAQIIALTIHGNASIKGAPQLTRSDFFPANSTFIFCEYVRFVDMKRNAASWDESDYASDPAAWFARLKQESVSALRLVHESTDGQKVGDQNVSDRMLVGFVGGGGRWLIEAIKPNGSDFWEGRWHVGDRQRSDRKIWRVSYGRTASDQPTLDRAAPEIAALKSQLDGNLRAISAFARKQRMDGFAKAFDAGLAQLNSPNPSKGLYHSDLAPQNGLSLPAAQLLGAVQAAWVFGGMGSWNDVGFEGEDQILYERLSEDLYRLLNTAIVVATNASIVSNQVPRAKPWWRIGSS
jgi:hypothetical protein